MRLGTYVGASLRHHWRSHAAVAVAVAIATAVITGALLVGSSMRGSLRGLVLDRLGLIDQVLFAPAPFRESLATELAATPGFATHFASAHAALLFTGSATHRQGGRETRASGLQVVGYDPGFWELDRQRMAVGSRPSGVLLTRSVAAELEVQAGDRLTLHLPRQSALPSDSPLGEKHNTIAIVTVQIAEVLPDAGLARFGLNPSQQTPRSVFVPLAALQRGLEIEGQANLLLVAGRQVAAPTGEAAEHWLRRSFRPRLADYGLSLEVDPSGRWLQLGSRGLVLSASTVKAAMQSVPQGNWQQVTAYLANRLQKVGAATSVPYSTVAGQTNAMAGGPLADLSHELAGDECAVNDWLARKLELAIGDRVAMWYYEPESTHGELREQGPAELVVRSILPLADELGEAAAAHDEALVPRLAGVTDEDSISDWQVPFELIERITDQDEKYWDDYRTTPKLFLSADSARTRFGSRWGEVSLVRLLGSDRSPADVAKAIESHLDPAKQGLVFQSAKRSGLQAASGTTPFDGLFLGLSMFLLVSSLLLVALLFRLGMELRSSELGLLLGIGMPRPMVQRIMRRESLLVAVVGSVLGLPCGVAFATTVLWALETIWIGAISAPFLELHTPWQVLAIGGSLGTVCAWLATRHAVQQLTRRSVGRLLAGAATPDVQRSRPWRQPWPWLAGLAAALLLGLASRLTGEARAGALFAAGALILATLLLALPNLLQLAGSAGATASMWRLALTNLSRNRTRSSLTVSLVGIATFLLLSISAFRASPTVEGTGGFDLIAECDQPLHFDLGTPSGRLELGLSDAEDAIFAGWHIASLRVRDGQDASCQNLYRPTQPRLVGVPDDFAGDLFGWSSRVDAATSWSLLYHDCGAVDGQPVVPVVLDAPTAAYSMQLYRGVGERLILRDADDREVTCEIVGLLKGSVLQGRVLMSEANLLRLFPEINGSRLVLLRAPSGATEADLASVAGVLEERLGDIGCDVTRTGDRLASLLAVQNTYLSTFQSLGALGLLLGTVGLAAVQLRSVLERRGELALLRATGFAADRLVRMVLTENLLLLALGLVAGLIAAAVVLVPLWSVVGGVPWPALPAVGIATPLAGVAAAWLATSGTVTAPLLPALRGD